MNPGSATGAWTGLWNGCVLHNGRWIIDHESGAHGDFSGTRRLHLRSWTYRARWLSRMCINWSRAKFGWRKSSTGRTWTISRSRLGMRHHLRTSRPVRQQFSSSRMYGDDSEVRVSGIRVTYYRKVVNERRGLQPSMYGLLQLGRKLELFVLSNTFRIFSRNRPLSLLP